MYSKKKSIYINQKQNKDKGIGMVVAIIKTILEIALGLFSGANFILASISETWLLNLLMGIALFYLAIHLSLSNKEKL